MNPYATVAQVNAALTGGAELLISRSRSAPKIWAQTSSSARSRRRSQHRHLCIFQKVSAGFKKAGGLRAPGGGPGRFGGSTRTAMTDKKAKVFISHSGWHGIVEKFFAELKVAFGDDFEPLQDIEHITGGEKRAKRVGQLIGGL